MKLINLRSGIATSMCWPWKLVSAFVPLLAFIPDAVKASQRCDISRSVIPANIVTYYSFSLDPQFEFGQRHLHLLSCLVTIDWQLVTIRPAFV